MTCEITATCGVPSVVAATESLGRSGRSRGQSETTFAVGRAADGASPCAMAAALGLLPRPVCRRPVRSMQTIRRYKVIWVDGTKMRCPGYCNTNVKPG